MGIFSKFEGRMEDTVEGAADRMANAPLSPVQIAKKAEKQMRREKMVGAGKQYAPTLYTVLVNPQDDERLFGYYPTLAGETETYLAAKAAEQGLLMDGQPLVRFIVDDGLRHGKFEVVAELVASPLIEQLRIEEMEHYGFASESIPSPSRHGHAYGEPPAAAEPQAARHQQQGFEPSPAQASVAQNALQNYDEYYNEEPVPKHQANAQSTPQHQAQKYPAQAPTTQPTQAYLFDEEGNRTYTLKQARMALGRESDNDIVIPDINVSRYHAEIRYEEPGVWVISDAGSTNGTYINGRQIKSQPLRDGDRITVGVSNLEFQFS